MAKEIKIKIVTGENEQTTAFLVKVDDKLDYKNLHLAVKKAVNEMLENNKGVLSYMVRKGVGGEFDE